MAEPGSFPRVSARAASLSFSPLSVDHGVAEIGSVEPGDELGVVLEVELVGDVAADEVGRRRGQGDARGRADLPTRQADSRA